MTLGDALSSAVRRLRAAGVETARLDARVLIGHVLGLDTTQMLIRPERSVSETEQAAINAALARRAAREPVARIVGTREFWSLPIGVGPATLVPRPDSETLIEVVLERFGTSDRAARILDLGTGSGCLLFALLREWPSARGVGLDINPEALKTADVTARSLGMAERVAWVHGTWDAPIEGTFDVVLSNPPYIPDDEIATLAPDVAEYDPRAALSGGVDGLDAYRALGPILRGRLAKGGAGFVEIGAGQDDAVTALFAESGLTVDERRADLAGIVRCLAVTAGND